MTDIAMGEKNQQKCPQQSIIALLFPLFTSLHERFHVVRCIDVLDLVICSFIHRQNAKERGGETDEKNKSKSNFFLFLLFH